MASSLQQAVSSHIIDSSSPNNTEKRKHTDDGDNEDLKLPLRKKPWTSRKRRPCVICAENIAKNQFPKLPHKQDETETHSSDVCFKCYRQYLSVEIADKGQDAVECPQCKKPLDQSEVRKLASGNTYQEYVYSSPFF